MAVYVLCPYKATTGGPELLHQLVYELNKLGLKTFITYYSNKEIIEGNAIPSAYAKYVKEFKTIDDISDTSENCVIFPETYSYGLLKFRNVHKFLWWLSVDFYFLGLNLRYEIKKDDIWGVFFWLKNIIGNFIKREPHYLPVRKLPQNIIHLVQSEYAASFLKQNGIQNFLYLSDYINDEFFDDHDLSNKKDIVLYNPKKGIFFTKKILKSFSRFSHTLPMPSNRKMSFVPLKNMNRLEMIRIMESAKVYIDFGFHPGKDRIPREAAILDCCIITGTKGAAANDIDVSIPQKYKFNQSFNAVKSIRESIQYCIGEYPIAIKDFEDYKSKISNEKNVFKCQVRELANLIATIEQS